jgi:menaquinone-dependent protoporphyrinogen oxidase
MTVDLRNRPAPRLESYDAVIVGASLHGGQYQKEVRRFVRQNHPRLELIPSVFFSVSLAALDPSEAARNDVQRCLDRFSRETGWRPVRVVSFAGALRYTRYGFFTRWLMKAIVYRHGSRDLDTSRDYEYTDWKSVGQFGAEFMEALLTAPEEACGCGCRKVS